MDFPGSASKMRLKFACPPRLAWGGLLLACVVAATAPSWTASGAGAAPVAVPGLRRDGDRIFVPEGSPFRGRIEVERVSTTSMPHRLPVAAVIEAEPARTVNVMPPMTGRIVELNVHLGDRVRRGQVLARIASPDLSQALADVQKADDALDLAGRAQRRALGVHDAGANAAKDLELADSAVNQARAESERAHARLRAVGAPDVAGRDGTSLAVLAPDSGIVTAMNVGAGAFANDATAPLMTVANLDRVWVAASVPDGAIREIHRGDPVEVTLPAYPDETFRCRVDLVSAVADADTRRTRVRCSLPNADGRLRPNLFATADFVVPQPPQPRVPTSALLMDNDRVTVFVEVAEWTFRRRVVEPGAEDDDRVRIVSGLAGGDRIVVRGGVLLND